jgi:hypothetical protein
MAKFEYTRVKMRAASLELVATCEQIIDDYTAQGFKLTVRQLYYQLVARGVVENTVQSYKRITSIVNDARMGGLLDWDAIEDRTRDFIRRTRWETGSQILAASSNSFHIDMWSNQDCRPFVIVEKEALVGVLQGVCYDFDVPLLAARGYPSSTVLRDFVESDIAANGHQHIQIFHLGDHDPSGIDMTRDLQERLSLFAEPHGINVALDRLALNYSQIEKLKPPPNPAKETDSRFAHYRKRHGDKSWELDAIPPTALSNIVRVALSGIQDGNAWVDRVEQRADVQGRIRTLAKSFKE